MSSIEDLRSRFKAAEERLDKAGAEQQDFGSNLIDLMGNIEGTLRRYKNDCVAQKEEAQRLHQENEELHGMLNKLLTQVESSQFGENLTDLALKLKVFEMPSGAATKGDFTGADAAQAPAPAPVEMPAPAPEDTPAPAPEDTPEPEAEAATEPQSDELAAKADRPEGSVEEMLESLIATAAEGGTEAEDSGLRVEPLLPEAFYAATDKKEASSVENVVQRVSDLVKGLTHAENSDGKSSIH